MKRIDRIAASRSFWKKALDDEMQKEYIFNQLEETRDAQIELEKKQRSLEAEFMNMVTKRDSLVQDYQTKAPLMGPEMQKNKENEK